MSDAEAGAENLDQVEAEESQTPDQVRDQQREIFKAATAAITVAVVSEISQHISDQFDVVFRFDDERGGELDRKDSAVVVTMEVDGGTYCVENVKIDLRRSEKLMKRLVNYVSAALKSKSWVVVSAGGSDNAPKLRITYPEKK